MLGRLWMYRSFESIDIGEHREGSSSDIPLIHMHVLASIDLATSHQGYFTNVSYSIDSWMRGRVFELNIYVSAHDEKVRPQM